MGLGNSIGTLKSLKKLILM